MNEMFLDELSYVEETLAIHIPLQSDSSTVINNVGRKKRVNENQTKGKSYTVRDNSKNTKKAKRQVVKDEEEKEEVEKRIEINADLFSIENEEVIFNVIKGSPNTNKKLSIVDEMNNIENMLTALHQASRFVNETQIKVKIELNI